MFRSHLLQSNEEEQLKHDTQPNNKKGLVSRFGINIRPPVNTITYVSPPSSPTPARNAFQERTDNSEREREVVSEYAAMDNQRDDTAYSYKNISDNSLARLKQLDPAHPMLSSKSRASSTRTQALDLKHNDNAFHIVASLIVDRFEEQLSTGNSKSIRIKAGDMYHMERVIPDKKSFIEAVQYRVINCPQDSTKPIHEVTRRCQGLGLGRKGKANLLYAPIGSVFEVSETKEPTKIRPVNTEAIQNAKPNTLDELARQQITTELNEAENLMKESVTPEAAEFWQKQVIELEAKLRALDGGNTENVEKDMNYFKAEQGLLSTLWQTIGYAPPTLEKQESARTTEEDPEKGIELTTSPVVSPSRRSSEDKDLPIVDVVAPNDLPGGYQFEAELNGKRFIATVPIGGVQKGKTFYCYMEPTDDAKIHVGGWKDSSLDTFKYGYKHPMVLTSIFFPLLALSQVMERIGLDITGKRMSSNTPQLALYTPRGMALSMLFVWAGLNVTILSGIEIKTTRYLAVSAADTFSLFLVNISLLIFTIYATINTRNYIMQRYQIPVSRVGSHLETLLAAVFFPLSIAQMGRHTASYDIHQAVCCHPTGVIERVEP